MKIKNIATALFVALILVSCVPVTEVSPTETAAPTLTLLNIPPIATVTPLPPEILNDIFIANYGDLKMVQIQNFTQKAEHRLSTFDTETTVDCKHTGQYGIHIKYGFPKEYTSRDYEYGMWGVGVNQLISQYPRIDIKNYKAIEFWVKGAIGGETFEIWLANEHDADIGLKSINYVDVSSKEWRKVLIPFSDFYRNGAFNEIYGVTFNFYSTNGIGNICIDDINFTK
jgi:hypothetical protein